MAKDSIRDYSATNSENTDIQSIDISEGCSPAGINNAIREVMADIKDVSTGTVSLETPSADQLNVDNLRLDGNTISSTDTNGNITIDPNGTGNVLVGTTDDGDIIDLRKDGSTVGSIGSNGGNPYFASTSVGLKLTTEVLPVDNNGASADGFLDLGGPSDRFNNLYLSGGVYLGGTGAANHLDDYEEGTWTPALHSATGTVYTTQAGTYTKVGKVVTVSFFMSFSTSPTSGSNIRMGLPFSARGSTHTYMHGNSVIIASGFNLTDDQKSQIRMSPYISGADFYFYNVSNGGVWNATSNFTAGSIGASITYETE